MTTTNRIFNFSAGPAVLPLEVLEEARENLLSMPGVGMSILEISHRSKPFDEIIEGAERDMRALAGIPDGYHVLFLQGGASLQFSMVPMNILPQGGSADYIVTGVWSQKAVKEAKRVGGVKVAASTEAENFTRVPAQSELTLDPVRRPTSTTRPTTPSSARSSATSPRPAAFPLVADTSSDMFSGPIDVVEVRPDLRRRAEEPRARRGDARDHPRRHAEADAGVDPDDAAVPGARGEQVAL